MCVVRPISPPPWATATGATGSRARGYAYERKVAKHLARLCAAVGWTLFDHQWFEYREGAVIKHFQPDFILTTPSGAALVAEVKLTDCDTQEQLFRYTRYLAHWGLRCVPLTIVRHLTPQSHRVVDTIEDIDSNSVLHLWI